MNRTEIQSFIKELKLKKGVKVYAPYKYFAGLETKRDIRRRFEEIVKGTKTDMTDSASYKPFSTDIGRQTKPSSYTQTFYKNVSSSSSLSLRQKAEVSGVPLDILKEVYDKGMAAWRTGHRVGATPEQWGHARVHSFLVLGCTVFSADFYLFEEALPRMKSVDRKRWLSLPIKCPKKILESPYYKKRGVYKKFIVLKKRYS